MSPHPSRTPREALICPLPRQSPVGCVRLSRHHRRARPDLSHTLIAPDKMSLRGCTHKERCPRIEKVSRHWYMRGQSLSLSRARLRASIVGKSPRSTESLALGGWRLSAQWLPCPVVSSSRRTADPTARIMGSRSLEPAFG